MATLVTGGTGLIGRALLTRIEDPVVLTRSPHKAAAFPRGVRTLAWDPEAGPPSLAGVDGIQAVFHLAGESVADGYWTEDKKARIHRSRVVGTRNLVEGLKAMEARPSVLVAASAVGFYGDRRDEILDESSAPGAGFLPTVCADWEAEAMKAEALGIRVVCLRIGVVLSTEGGALARMVPAFRWGAGGRLGNGKQWMPWIHIDDVVGLLLHAQNQPQVRGPMNAVAPQAVTNGEFTQALARALHRPALMAIPETALRLVFGEMSQVLLVSQRVVPQVAQRTGYEFQEPTLQAALESLLRRPRSEAA